jgi:hypothetical protein
VKREMMRLRGFVRLSLASVALLGASAAANATYIDPGSTSLPTVLGSHTPSATPPADAIVTGRDTLHLTGMTAPNGFARPNITVDDDGAEDDVVPLPAAAWLLLSGVVGLGAMARRRMVIVEG